MTEKEYTQSIWSLSDLFDSFDDPKIEETYQALTKSVEEFEGYREQLTADISSEKFLEIVSEMEKTNKLAYRLYGFASLSFASNTQDQKAQIAIARVQQFVAELENRTLFFSLWWKALDDENATRLLESSG